MPATRASARRKQKARPPAPPSKLAADHAKKVAAKFGKPLTDVLDDDDDDGEDEDELIEQMAKKPLKPQRSKEGYATVSVAGLGKQGGRRAGSSFLSPRSPVAGAGPGERGKGIRAAA
jgi:hypothetical protein